MDEIANEFAELLRDTVEETAGRANADFRHVKQYAVDRMKHLASIRKEAGFLLAVRAEADSVALAAGLNITSSADALDTRLRGVIKGALALGARALSILT